MHVCQSARKGLRDVHEIVFRVRKVETLRGRKEGHRLLKKTSTVRDKDLGSSRDMQNKTKQNTVRVPNH